MPAWTVIGIAAGAALLGSDRRNVDWTHIVRLVPGTLIGIALGLVVFTRLSSDALARGLGVFVLLYGCYALWRTFRAGSLHVSQRLAAALGGIGGGITGTVVGTMGSTFYAVYFDAVSLNKDSYRATMTAILMTLTVTRGLGYLLIGEFSMEALYLAAFLLPSMVVGLLIGQRLHHGISEITFPPPHRGGGIDRVRLGFAREVKPAHATLNASCGASTFSLSLAFRCLTARFELLVARQQTMTLIGNAPRSSDRFRHRLAPGVGAKGKPRRLAIPVNQRRSAWHGRRTAAPNCLCASSPAASSRT